MAGADGSDEISGSDFIDEVGGRRGHVPSSQEQLINAVDKRIAPYLQGYHQMAEGYLQMVEILMRENSNLRSQLKQKEDILKEKEEDIKQLSGKADKLKEEKEKEIKDLKEEIENLKSTIDQKEEDIAALKLKHIQPSKPPSKPRRNPISLQGSEKNRAKEMKLLREEENNLEKQIESQECAKQKVKDEIRKIKLGRKK